MIINKQKNITIINKCDCIFDAKDLVDAMIWYSDKPISRIKTVFIHGKYPAVSIYDQKIHVHRLLVMYYNNCELERHLYVHHINGNKLDSSKENLEIQSASEHQRNANLGKKLSEKHKEIISISNRKRVGTKYKKTLNLLTNLNLIS